MPSSNIKFQDLPEFRVQQATIATVKEETDHYNDDFTSEFYTKLKIEQVPFSSNDPFTQEYSMAAKNILSLLETRDKYIFEHCQCKA